MQTHIATSGWFYRDWQGGFYPAELPSHRWFRHYTQQFNTVELNAPFYRWPKPETVKTWNRQAPEHFRYCIKVNRLITHLKRFSGTESLIRDFYQIADMLGPKLGCFLFQLPPNFEFTAERLAMILAQLDPAHRNVLEFRHVSWWTPEVFAALEKHKIIFCSVSAPKLPNDLIVTADTVYVRFHGRKRWFYGSYSDENLSGWRAKILASGANDAWIYFNNTADGSAIANARSLKENFQHADAVTPNKIASGIYNSQTGQHDGLPCGETDMLRVNQLPRKNKIMGDKSPKANQKKSGQKQTKTSSANQKKSAAVAAKSAAGKKK